MTERAWCHVQVKALIGKQAMDRDHIRKLERRCVAASHRIQILHSGIATPLPCQQYISSGVMFTRPMSLM